MSSTSPASPVWDNQLVIGGHLSSGSSDYLVQSFLGQGSFGTVAKCMRLNDMKTVAIKMIKNEGYLIRQAREEASILLQLKSLDSDKCNIVQWYQDFTDRGHMCLEFEHLDKSLLDYLMERCSAYQPVLLKEIRPIVQQIANALHHLKTVGIIHADLKLENVMLVNHAQEPYRLKVIDFGLADEVSAATMGSYIQSRAYRSPEIILGLPYTEAIDMWSLGCLAASLYISTLLYPGSSEYDMIRYIMETQGQPPDDLLDMGCKTLCFFVRDHNSTSSLWKLKTPEQFHQETGIQPMETRISKFSSLDDLQHIRFICHDSLTDDVAETNDLLMFVDLLKGMLHLDASERLTPRQVLEHPFISMDHMADLYDLSSHVKSCFEIMEVCLKTETSACRSAVCRSLQQSSPRTAHPVQTDDEDGNKCESSSSLDSTKFILATSYPVYQAHPFISTRTLSCRKQGIKRKMSDDEDVEHQQSNTDSHQMSHHESKRFRESEGPSTSRSSCSSSSWTQSDVSPRVKRKSNSSSNRDSTKYILATTAINRPDNHLHNVHLSTSSQTPSNIRPGIKRKMVDDEDVELQQTSSDGYQRSTDRKRFRKSCACPSISIKSSGTQSDASPIVKRKQDSSSSQDSTKYILATTAVSRPACTLQDILLKLDSNERSGHERKRVRKSDAGSATCRNYSTQTLHMQPDQRSSPAEQRRHSPHHASSSQIESRTRSGLKRKAADDDDVGQSRKTSDLSPDNKRRRDAV